MKSKSIYAERVELFLRLFQTTTVDTTEKIASLFASVFENGKTMREKTVAKELATKILALMDKGLSEKNLLSEAKRIQEEIIKNL